MWYKTEKTKNFGFSQDKTRQNQMGYKIERFDLNNFSLVFSLFGLDRNYGSLELNHHITKENHQIKKKTLSELYLYLLWVIILGFQQIQTEKHQKILLTIN